MKKKKKKTKAVQKELKEITSVYLKTSVKKKAVIYGVNISSFLNRKLEEHFRMIEVSKLEVSKRRHSLLTTEAQLLIDNCKKNKSDPIRYIKGRAKSINRKYPFLDTTPSEFEAYVLDLIFREKERK